MTTAPRTEKDGNFRPRNHVVVGSVRDVLLAAALAIACTVVVGFFVLLVEP